MFKLLPLGNAALECEHASKIWLSIYDIIVTQQYSDECNQM